MRKPFTPRQPRKFIGQYRPRLDGLEKASGRAVYADDFANKTRFPDMLYAKVLHSPHPHARIKSLDVGAAERLPGVAAVLTYRDPEVARLKPTSAGWTDGVDTVSYERMMWKRFRDRRVLGDTAHWVGDDLGVVVAAETEAAAEEALRLVKIEWEVLPFVLDPLEAMKPGAPPVHPEVTPNNVLPADPVGGGDVFLTKGDAERGLAQAEVVAEATSVYHNATQCSLDNWCCLVTWDDDKLTCWSNSYEADMSRMHISQMLDLPLHKVRVVSPFVGGQFGRGDTGEQPFFLFTALLAKRTGRPVKFKHTRRESFHDSRQPAIYHGKAGATKDGTITTLHFKSVGNAGAYADHTMFALKFAPAEVAEVAFAHIPNLKMESYGVYTNVLPACMMRGVGNSQLNFILGHLMDALAEKLGMDPLDLVAKNFGHAWAQPPDKSLAAVLSAGAERIGWAAKRHAPGRGPAREGVIKSGVGFSFHPGWHAEWQEARRGRIQVGLRLNCDGTVMLEAPTVEVGTGSNTCNVLGCAEALGFLGVTPADISFSNTVDTDTGLKDTVQTDSAVSFLQSEALVVAARELKAKVLEAAAGKLGARPEDLDVADGWVFPKSAPKDRRSLPDVLWQGDLVPIAVTVSRPPSSEKTGVPFQANFAEVEVDTSTGQARIVKLVVVNDCGTVMYPSGAEGQQIGGQCMSVGESLTEEIIYDPATGIPLNFNWIDYQIPTMADIPDIEPVLLEVWRGAGEYGACGIGEGVLTCTPAAVLNAIYNAIGARVDVMPFKPEKILAALGMADPGRPGTPGGRP
ncbi:MAG: xanthine dehydrogenase family protein molybdopterin-binding subunit [Elusimicrobia bacterium]|nr:xanthine dehydrogenase family protein molybdopterin-binding subunit [Elusimicrobiota bacterium]